ncbi:hypothetical protein RJ640_001538 [Escallonia rubra]|uniref:non-specific serine/threonine protein kinase n=1 Tax=Escallonia rubra TaxID=112253 RepID=A0AA88RF49_9ASTE|nr:hypothetical protein RJ640_001538 [Escallonia rubra]
MAPGNPSRFVVLLLVLVHVVASSSRSDSEILLKFKDSLRNKNSFSDWNPSKAPCSNSKANWAGILCNKGDVWGLKLEKMGLQGVLDVEPLRELSSLRTMSLMNNELEGGLPDMTKLGALKTLYLSNNKFSGEIPGNAFDGMLSLKKLYLAHNRFSGAIPSSLTRLPRLSELMLEGNEFDGDIPDFQQERLQRLNVSHNKLEGRIPSRLSKLNASSFSGNNDLCGPPLGSCSSGKVSVVTIIIIVIVVVAALAAVAAAIIIILRRRKKTASQPEDQQAPAAASADLDKMEQGASSSSSPEHSTHSYRGQKTVHNDQSAGSKLSFLREDIERFELSDLLRSSAEVLGGGVFGSTYKAALSPSRKVVAVKRFRQMNNVGKEEFQEHMRRLGRLRHNNLLPLLAYYYRKEEKLLVSDYVDNVSLAVHLHGNRGRNQPSPDWPTRLKIVKGVARGLLYLYNELPSLIAPHGHLKSSNVLLNESSEPLLTDYGLAPVVNQEHAQELMIAYKSPEYKQNGRITRKTDVWSLGILILEILTGKFPTNSLQQGKGSDADLGTWVQTMVREEWDKVEVFDKEMGGTKSNEGEMIKLLKIGLSCCEVDVEKRMDMKEIVDRIEELREKDGDEDFYSSYTSEGDMRSSRGLSDDFAYSING